MALIQASYYSQAINRPTEFSMILPNDIPDPEPGANLSGNPHYTRPAKTLILLHGYSGSHRDWLLGCPIQDLALKYNLAVVMPSGENSFYLDRKGSGRSYSKLVGEELIAYLRRTFHLSAKREDTFIGGYSMGGFGALHTGLMNPQNYSKIIALSSALIVHQVATMHRDTPPHGIADYDYYASTFGIPEQVVQSDCNPEILIHRLKDANRSIPGIYMACGTEDFLLDNNREFHAFLKSQNIDHLYEEAPGSHDWKFWNSCIEPAIRWALA